MIFILATFFLLGSALVDPTSRIPTIAVLGIVLAGIPFYYLMIEPKKGR
jgi:hypothetical protein